MKAKKSFCRWPWVLLVLLMLAGQVFAAETAAQTADRYAAAAKDYLSKNNFASAADAFMIAGRSYNAAGDSAKSLDSFKQASANYNKAGDSYDAGVAAEYANTIRYKIAAAAKTAPATTAPVATAPAAASTAAKESEVIILGKNLYRYNNGVLEINVADVWRAANTEEGIAFENDLAAANNAAPVVNNPVPATGTTIVPKEGESWFGANGVEYTVMNGKIYDGDSQEITDAKKMQVALDAYAQGKVQFSSPSVLTAKEKSDLIASAQVDVKNSAFADAAKKYADAGDDANAAVYYEKSKDYSNAGMYYEMSNDYSKAAANYVEAAKTYEKSKDVAKMKQSYSDAARNYVNIAKTQTGAEQKATQELAADSYEKAEKYSEAIALYNQLGNNNKVAFLSQKIQNTATVVKKDAATKYYYNPDTASVVESTTKQSLLPLSKQQADFINEVTKEKGKDHIDVKYDKTSGVTTVTASNLNKADGSGEKITYYKGGIILAGTANVDMQKIIDTEVLTSNTVNGKQVTNGAPTKYITRVYTNVEDNNKFGDVTELVRDNSDGTVVHQYFSENTKREDVFGMTDEDKVAGLKPDYTNKVDTTVNYNPSTYKFDVTRGTEKSSYSMSQQDNYENYNKEVNDYYNPKIAALEKDYASAKGPAKAALKQKLQDAKYARDQELKLSGDANFNYNKKALLGEGGVTDWSEAIWSNVAGFMKGYNDFSGLGRLSSLFIDDKDLQKRRTDLIQSFCLFGGLSKCFTSQFCAKGMDTALGGAVAGVTSSGELAPIAHIEGDKTPPIIGYENKSWSAKVLYRVTYVITNIGETDMSYNVYFLPGNKKWYAADQKLKVGTSASRKGTGALVTYGVGNYNSVCIRFTPGISKIGGGTVTEMCNSLNTYTGQPTEYQKAQAANVSQTAVTTTTRAVEGLI